MPAFQQNKQKAYVEALSVSASDAVDYYPELLFHVASNIRICILVNAQCTAGMLYKEVEKSGIW